MQGCLFFVFFFFSYSEAPSWFSFPSAPTRYRTMSHLSILNIASSLATHQSSVLSTHCPQCRENERGSGILWVWPCHSHLPKESGSTHSGVDIPQSNLFLGTQLPRSKVRQKKKKTLPLVLPSFTKHTAFLWVKARRRKSGNAIWLLGNINIFSTFAFLNTWTHKLGTGKPKVSICWRKIKIYYKRKSLITLRGKEKRRYSASHM